MQTDISLKSFAPGALIELADPLSGTRHLALVAESGKEFIGYLDENNPATPLPILAVLKPVQCGDYALFAEEVMLQGDMQRHAVLSDFLVALCDTPAVFDALTLNRAVKWAVERGVYDPEQAAQAGIEATKAALAWQQIMSAAILALQETGGVMDNPIMNEKFGAAMAEAISKAVAEADALGLPKAYIDTPPLPAVPETRTIHLGRKEKPAFGKT